MSKITWLASYPKSGNTWMRLLMAAYLKRGAPDIRNIGFGLGDLRPDVYHKVLPEDIRLENIDLPMQALIRPAALAGLIQKEDCLGGIFLKTHHANAQIDDVALIPPALTEQAIYMVRDPRQVAVSYANHFQVSIDDAIRSLNDPNRVIGNVGELKHVLGTWSQHVLSWLGSGFPVYCMRYEDIGPGAFSGLLRFLGLEPDYERVLQAFEDCELSKMMAQEKEHGFQEAPEGITFFGQGEPWYNVLTADQADQIVSDHGEAMEKLKYDTGTLHYKVTA